MTQPYACQAGRSRGRRFDEPAAPTRSEFQRDRDRVVHSASFRRLVYKTQVFLNHEGDLFRTRLTHSLEVAQLGRSIARPLGLNEDLVEAMALAHDLGHTPFGHAGQDALNECVSDADPSLGGFEHNLQSLRVVDQLEERYPEFDGLNLSFETREGILKHCSRAHAEQLEALEPGGVAFRFTVRQQPSLEAQLCNLADEIAYNAHDVDDGVRSGLLILEQLDEVPLIHRFLAEVREQHAGLEAKRLLAETIRRMLSAQVYDVLAETQKMLTAHRPGSVEEVRQMPRLVNFSNAMAQESRELKAFLRSKLYRHSRVVETTGLGKQVIRELFEAYSAQPAEWPLAQARSSKPDRPFFRALADYIAGMTDRFALREHERLTGRRIFAV